MLMPGLPVRVLLAAAPLKLGVLSVAVPSELQAIGAEVTLLVERTARSSGYDVVPSQSLREALGEDAFAAAQGCLGKVDCVVRKLQGHPLQRVVTGKLERDDVRYRLR